MKLYSFALPPLTLSCAAFLVIQGGGCADTEDFSFSRQDNWTIVGKVSDSTYRNGEAIAVSGDGSRFRTGITDEQNFGLELPGNTNYALYFLPAIPTINKTAHLRFEADQNTQLSNTLRLPEPLFNHILDLGEIDISNQTALPTQNPASRLDFDRDGILDFVDGDDQNDGLLDYAQQNDRLQKTTICHVDKNRSIQTITVDLPELYAHIQHGDNPWPCRRKKAVSSIAK